MKEINYIGFWQGIKDFENIRDYISIVIDVLRATSFMVTAFSRGAERIIPVDDFKKGLLLKKKLREEGEKRVYLCGEINSLPFEGADFGNSPTEILNKDLKGYKLIHFTTNGTRAINNVRGSKKVYICSFLNVSITAEKLIDSNKILIVASGDKGKRSLEDEVCAGCLIDKLIQKSNLFELKEGAKRALNIWREYKKDLSRLKVDSEHAVELMRLGFKEDVEYCLAVDRMPILSQLKDYYLEVSDVKV